MPTLTDDRQEGEKAILFLKNLPPDLKREFKCWCIRHRVTMTDQVIKMIDELLMITRETNR